MKINLSFLVDFLTGLGKKKLLIISITLAVFLCLLVTLPLVISKNNKKSQAGDLEEQKSEDSLDTDFYTPEADDGAWVEGLLAQIEEERIAEEIRAMEESREEYEIDDESEIAEAESVEEGETEEAAEMETPETSENSETSEEPVKISEVEKFFNEEKTESIKTGKNDHLSFYEFDNEILASQDSEGNHILIHSDKERVSRFFYDKDYQLIKKEMWNIPSVEKAVLEKTELYEYFENSIIVSEKKIIGPYSIENVKYNKEGKTVSAEKYAVVEDKKHITSKRLFSYDEEGNLLSDELKEYFYKADDYKEVDYSFTKKYLYSYNEEGIPPDFKYFENGNLKMHNKYSTEKGNYTSRIYFDEGLSVKAYYENDIRVRDLYYRNNSVIREKFYEQPEKSEE